MAAVKRKMDELMDGLDFDKGYAAVEDELRQALQDNPRKIIVLDDDPTGVQTVHGVSVYTDWSLESIEAGFDEENQLFFILTNSRSFTAEETEEVHRVIAANILEVSQRRNREFLLISRSDSTLRGHYPLETQVLQEEIEKGTGQTMDGEVIIPFFLEGGRFTIHDIHYVQEGEYLIPAAETEFARDKTFGYVHSHLKKWVVEKSGGNIREADTVSISLYSIRALDIAGITEQLMTVSHFGKVVVNAVSYEDLKVFVLALLGAMTRGKNYLFRTAASFTRVMGGIVERPLLVREELIKKADPKGGLIVIGSHVQKTTEQLEQLMRCHELAFIEFNQHLVLDPPALDGEVERAVSLCEAAIRQGRTAVVYTRRDRFDLDSGNVEEELRISVRISDAVMSIVKRLKTPPGYIVAKGGITSSDIGTRGLLVKKALVMGQIKPGIPVWMTGEESRFPQTPYVVFPGNVGTPTTLKDVVDILDGHG